MTARLARSSAEARLRGWPPAAPGTLENMGPPPTQITFSGSRVDLPGIQFSMPPELPPWRDPAGPGEYARWLGLDLPGDWREAERLLRRLVAGRVPELPLPPVAVVSADLGLATAAEADPLSVVTVLSKSSDTVYLAAKEPNFSRLVPRRTAVLLIPPTWRSA
ncbi:MAG: hypothetical protein KatS3mg062_0505 [Tepidiforma sp.]|nr:MAG: hypothetical protein KatS3mg062_0505 [Tepidiforma sp.]